MEGVRRRVGDIATQLEVARELGCGDRALVHDQLVADTSQEEHLADDLVRGGEAALVAELLEHLDRFVEEAGCLIVVETSVHALEATCATRARATRPRSPSAVAASSASAATAAHSVSRPRLLRYRHRSSLPRIRPRGSARPMPSARWRMRAAAA